MMTALPEPPFFTPFAWQAGCSLKTLVQASSRAGLPHEGGKESLSEKQRSQNICSSEASLNYSFGFESYKNWAHPGCWLSLLSALSAEEEAREAPQIIRQLINTPVSTHRAEAVSKHWLQFQELKSDTTESTGVKWRHGELHFWGTVQRKQSQAALPWSIRLPTLSGVTQWQSFITRKLLHLKARNPSHQLLLLTSWRKNCSGLMWRQQTPSWLFSLINFQKLMEYFLLH